MIVSVPLPTPTTVTVAGKGYELEGTVSVDCNIVDAGIGAFEYWGAPGFDSAMAVEDLELVELNIDCASSAGDEVPVDPPLQDAILAVLQEAYDRNTEWTNRLVDDLFDALDDRP